MEVGALQGQQAGQAQLPTDGAEGQARRLLQVPHAARRRARGGGVGQQGLEFLGGLDQQGELPFQQPAEGEGGTQQGKTHRLTPSPCSWPDGAAIPPAGRRRRASQRENWSTYR